MSVHQSNNFKKTFNTNYGKISFPSVGTFCQIQYEFEIEVKTEPLARANSFLLPSILKLSGKI